MSDTLDMAAAKTAPADEELIRSARELAPRIAERAAEVADMRKPHDDTIQELVEAGIVQMFVPRRWGGSEASFSTMYDVLEPIAAACPSTGWIASFYIIHNTYIAKFPEETQEEVFSKKGYTLLPTGFAPDLQARRVDGGWRISGKAIWGSGIMHADWVMLTGPTPEGDRSFLLPVEEVEMKDVWFFTGMSGTGSNDFVADDVFVPDARTITREEFFESNSEGTRVHANPMYRMPFFIAAYCTILPVVTGAYLGAVRAYEKIVENKRQAYTGNPLKEHQGTHMLVGEFEIALEVARTLSRAVYARAEEVLAGKGEYDLEHRLKAKELTAYLSDLCRHSANRIMSVAGSSSFHNDQTVQRIWRDLNTVCSHAFWELGVTRELVGRHRLGFEPNNPLV